MSGHGGLEELSVATTGSADVDSHLATRAGRALRPAREMEERVHTMCTGLAGTGHHRSALDVRRDRQRQIRRYVTNSSGTSRTILTRLEPLGTTYVRVRIPSRAPIEQSRCSETQPAVQDARVGMSTASPSTVKVHNTVARRSRSRSADP
jgi:hypothetical protein